MKHKSIIFLSIILLALVSKLDSQQSYEVRFKEGTDLYSEGKYTEASEIWLSLYESGNRSAELNYNIGNALFKKNNIPGAILYYERALLQKPADEDILYNLQIARTFVVDKFTEIPELFFVTWYNFISLSLSSNAWAIISLSSFILFLVLFSVYIYSRSYRIKVIGFWIAVLMIFLSITGISFSLTNKKLVYNSNKAIIFSPLVNGKSSPDKSGTDLFLIHEGTKVTIVDEVGSWYEIRLADGNKGWVPADCLNKI